MPYASVADVPDSVPSEYRAQWREIWNSVYSKKIDDGAAKEDAESPAFQQANGVIKKRKEGAADEPTEPTELADTEKDSSKQYLIVDEKGNGHLKVRQSPDGPLDHGLMGGAYAALYKNYRGNKYQGPGADEAKSKLKSLYRSEGMDWPGDFEKASEQYHFAVRLIESLPTPEIINGKALYKIPIAVTGTWHKGGREFSITNRDFDDVIRNFNKRKNGQVVIDYEHASEDPDVARGGPVIAAGWIHSLSRNGALNAMTELTMKALQMIRDGEYRFVSPAFDWGARDKRTGEEQGATLTSCALTNHPFLEELPPLKLAEIYESENAVLLSDVSFQGAEMNEEEKKKKEAEEAAKVLAAEAEKKAKEEETKKIKLGAKPKDGVGDGDGGEQDGSVPRVSMRRFAGDHAKFPGKHGIYRGGELMGVMGHKKFTKYAAGVGMSMRGSEKSKDGEEVENERKEHEAEVRTELLTEIGCKELSSVQIKDLIERGKTASTTEAASSGRKILMREAVKEGTFIKDRAQMAAATNPGQVTMEDYIAFDKASELIERGLREGKIFPFERSFFFSDALERPKDFEEWLKKRPASLNFSSVGNPTDGLGNGGTATEEFTNRIAELQKENPKLTYRDAVSKVRLSDKELTRRYDAEHRREMGSDNRTM